MQNTARIDLTQAPVFRSLLKISLPIMAASFLQMTYNLIDMFYLGRVGSNALAASGTAGLFMWMSMGPMLLCSMGASIGVSQSFGRKDIPAAKRYAQTAVFLALVLGLLYGASLILFRQPFVAFFGFTDPALIADTQGYLAIVGCSIVLVYISACISAAFTASGDAKTPFLLSLVGLIVNLVLDPILIFSCNLGVMGAAYATIAGQASVFLVQLYAMKRHKNRPFDTFSFLASPDLVKLRQILKWTVPVALESMFFCGLAMVTSRLEASYGAHVLAMNRIASQVESLSWLVGGGFGSAVTAFVGQNYGAGAYDRIKKGVKIGNLAMIGWGSMVTVLLFFGGRLVFNLFMPSGELTDLAIPYMKIIALVQIPMCLEAVANGAFKGLGRTVKPAIASIVSNIFRVILAYILSATPLGLYGIFLAIGISAFVRDIWCVLWYRFDTRNLGASVTVK